MSDPRRVEKRFWAISTTSYSSLLGHHDDAGIDAVWITGLRSVSADLVDIPDEVSDDQARVVVRNRIVTITLAWVVEAATLSSPTGDVEMAEAGHGHRT